MVAAVPEHLRALIVFAAGTGLRQGECCGLTLDRVDFLRREVRVDLQLVGTHGRVSSFGPPKSAAGYRTVPLPATLTDALAAHPARDPVGAHGQVFTNRAGDPLRRNAFGEVWHRSAAHASLPDWATFHDLRHFYASLLIARNCSIKAVQKRLSHHSATVTLDTYSHLCPDSDDETRAAVDSVLARVAV